MIRIKKLESIKEVIASKTVILKSFGTVAAEFGLTKDNCPSNAAFVTDNKLVEMSKKGIEMFGLFNSSKQIGFVALEQAHDEIYYLEKLAVIPEQRQLGYGTKLLDYSFDHVKEKGGKKISIGIINENEILKNWYINYGFTVNVVKTFSHLPFTVCLLFKDI